MQFLELYFFLISSFPLFSLAYYIKIEITKAKQLSFLLKLFFWVNILFYSFYLKRAYNSVIGFFNFFIIKEKIIHYQLCTIHYACFFEFSLAGEHIDHFLIFQTSLPEFSLLKLFHCTVIHEYILFIKTCRWNIGKVSIHLNHPLISFSFAFTPPPPEVNAF